MSRCAHASYKADWTVLISSGDVREQGVVSVSFTIFISSCAESVSHYDISDFIFVNLLKRSIPVSTAEVASSNSRDFLTRAPERWPSSVSDLRTAEFLPLQPQCFPGLSCDTARTPEPEHQSYLSVSPGTSSWSRQ